MTTNPSPTANLSPTAHAILEALASGAADAAGLRRQTRRTKATIDKAIADLTTAGLIIALPAGGDDPQRWSLTEATTEDGASHDAESNEAPETKAPGAEAADPTEEAAGSQEALPDAGTAGQPESADEAGDSSTPEASDPRCDAPAEPATQDSGYTDTGAPEAAEPKDDGEEGEQVKLCRGCQAQIPLICPCCGQKTSAWCAECRKNRPTTRRGEPREPVILSNGLPKLTPGQLEELVLEVMRTHPMPTFVGVTGWTTSRIAIYQPGRSVGALGKALDNLVTRGHAEQIGDTPKRYQLKATPEPDIEPAVGSLQETQSAADDAPATETTN